jgi:hypothetical protein
VADKNEAPKLPQLPEPSAWMHRQGNHTEVSERELDDDERERGWTQEPLYTADQVTALIAQAVREERERCAQACEALSLYDEDDPGASFAAAIRAMPGGAK